jgi:hypothetical protein
MQLPDLKAPDTLIPGVLDRIAEPAPSVWYQRAWWQWPLGLRIASALSVIGMLWTLAWLGGSVGGLGLASSLRDFLTATWASVAATLDQLGVLFGSSNGFWSERGQLILICTATLLLASYLTCVAAGTALYRLAWRRI